MKKTFAKVISLLCLSALLLTGCNAGGSQPPANAETTSAAANTTAQEQSTTAPKEKVNLVLWYWQGEMEELWRNNLLKDFETPNPDISVKLEIMPWGEYWQKVQTSMAAGGFPDVLNMSVAFVDVYAKKNVLTNLHAYIQKDIDMSKYYEKAFQSVRYPSIDTGEEYGMPWAFAENALFYNKGMFDSAKLAYPDDTWTWDNVREAAKKLTNITDKLETTKYGFVSSTDYTFFDSVIYSYGGRIVSEDLSRCMLNQPEAVAATQFMVDLVLKDKVSPKPGVLKQGFDSAFQTGIVGMEVSGAWMLDTMQGAKDFQWGVAPLPKGPKGRFVRAWCDSMTIPAESKHKDEAWRFIKFLVSDKGQTLNNLQSRIPVLKSASTDPNWLQPGKSPVDKKMLLDYLPESSPFVFRGGWGEWLGALINEVDPAFAGDKPVKEALDAATKAIDEILAKNK